MKTLSSLLFLIALCAVHPILVHSKRSLRKSPPRLSSSHKSQAPHPLPSSPTPAPPDPPLPVPPVPSSPPAYPSPLPNPTPPSYPPTPSSEASPASLPEGNCVLDDECGPSQHCNTTEYGITIGTCTSGFGAGPVSCTRNRQCAGMPHSTPIPACMRYSCNHFDTWGCYTNGKPDDGRCLAPDSFCQETPDWGDWDADSELSVSERDNRMGYCRTTLDAGATCTRDQMCYSGRCELSPGSSTGRCSRGHQLPCSSTGQCSGQQFCHNGVCVSRLAKGGLCLADEHCLSGSCGTGRCT
mmetsp:Transcript_38049/g.84722  ORF Transcript_38049/g.84722 Transcript_38049/m.84722 type:complete len:297 (+) Transcript_38049:74-964(+)